MEKVKAGPGMITGLLKGDVEETRVDSLFRVERRVSFELEALCELVLDLELGAEDVGRRPGVGEDSSVLVVGVFALEVTCNMARL